MDENDRVYYECDTCSYGVSGRFDSETVEAKLDVHEVENPDHRMREIPVTYPNGIYPVRKLAGHGLICLCAVLDWIPWHAGRWYLHGRQGCMLKLATKGFALLREEEKR